MMLAGTILPILAILPWQGESTSISTNDPAIVYSPYNWYHSSAEFAQTPNPGAYLKFGFTGTRVEIKLDVSTLLRANTPATQFPLVRYSVDGGPATTVQLTPSTASIVAVQHLPAGNHSLLFQYVSGYVFLDFWSPVNAVRITGFALDPGAAAIPVPSLPDRALFLGDSITNGDDDTATFAGGITNAVETQDATIGYPSLVASALRAEYGIVAYGGASWDGKAADGQTPGLMTFYSMIDRSNSRLINGKFAPAPTDIFVNMGENAGPTGDDVPRLLTRLRLASNGKTNVFLLIPFSGRSRQALTAGFKAYRTRATKDQNTYLLDLGDNPYLPVGRPTMMSVDGQHPLAILHAQLAAQIVQARADLVSGRTKP